MNVDFFIHSYRFKPALSGKLTSLPCVDVVKPRHNQEVRGFFFFPLLKQKKVEWIVDRPPFID